MIKFITAGGGLVQNGFGEYLLIFRNGKWDLPKGKQERGEKIYETALREVQEECGLDSLMLGRFIACTWHSYWLYDVETDGHPSLHFIGHPSLHFIGHQTNNKETDCNPSLHFKQTFWYRMHVKGRPKYHPQIEEGIEMCLWCTAEEAAICLSESYPSIQWLFRRVTGVKI